jgi:hypothetical protein
MRVNMVGIVCPHVYKWKNETYETIPGMGEGKKGQNDRRVNSTMIYCKNFVNVTMYFKYNNNNKITLNK